MKFLNKIIRSDVDLEGYNSLLIHSLIGCNLKCYKCHNYKELVETEHKKYYTDKDIINKLILSGYFFDALIISGGEFLIEDIEDIINFLKNIREIFNGKIIINTNGTFPEKIKKIIDLKLTDGFHMDLKFNIWEKLDNNSQKILGIHINENIRLKMLESFEIIDNCKLELCEFRTIKYPVVPEEYFDDIKKVKKNKVWKLNNFYEI